MHLSGHAELSRAGTCAGIWAPSMCPLQPVVTYKFLNTVVLQIYYSRDATRSVPDWIIRALRWAAVLDTKCAPQSIILALPQDGLRSIVRKVLRNNMANGVVRGQRVPPCTCLASSADCAVS